MNLAHFADLLPVGVVLTAALVVVFLGLILDAKDRFVIALVAMAGCVLGLGVLAQNYVSFEAYYKVTPPWFGPLDSARVAGHTALICGGAFMVDGFGMAIMAIALLAGALATLVAGHSSERSALTSGEYHGLLLLAVAGMMLLGISHDFLTLLISLEIMSVATYILAGSQREDVRSGEAAIKYLTLGAFSTALLMLGMAFVFGATGSLSLNPISMAASDPRRGLALLGMGLLLVGVLFKVGAAPFHFWIPDVYEGAPTGVTGLMAVGVKAAAFAVVARLMFETFSHPSFRQQWVPLLASASVLTMALGNLLALRQNSIKRMLAYSGIAHTGYLLLAFLVPREVGASVVEEHLQAVTFYLLAYGLMTMGAFGVVALVREDGRALETMDDFAGLAKAHPALALCMSIFMLSLSGMPPLAGFFAKFMVFRAAIEQGYVFYAMLGILTSIASLYYYLRVVLKMYMEEPAGAAPRCHYVWTSNVLIYTAGALTFVLGILPHWIIGLR